MENQKNNKWVIILLIIIIIILAVLCVLFATGNISFKKEDACQNVTNNENNAEKSWPVVQVKSFEIESAKVVNAPNNHLLVTGKFVLDGNYDDYENVGFSGYCIDVDDNKYEVHAPGVSGHKYEIGENVLDAAESFNYDYGLEYNLYDDNSDTKEWKNIEFKSCTFNKMTTTVIEDEKIIEISEPISFEKEF